MGDIKKDLDIFHRKLRLKAAFEKSKLHLEQSRLDFIQPARRGRPPSQSQTQLDMSEPCPMRASARHSLSQIPDPEMNKSSTIETDPSTARYVGGFKHKDFKSKTNRGKDPVNPPDALVALIMANELDLASVKIRNRIRKI